MLQNDLIETPNRFQMKNNRTITFCRPRSIECTTIAYPWWLPEVTSPFAALQTKAASVQTNYCYKLDVRSCPNRTNIAPPTSRRRSLRNRHKHSSLNTVTNEGSGQSWRIDSPKGSLSWSTHKPTAPCFPTAFTFKIWSTIDFWSAKVYSQPPHNPRSVSHSNFHPLRIGCFPNLPANAWANTWTCKISTGRTCTSSRWLRSGQTVWSSRPNWSLYHLQSHNDQRYTKKKCNDRLWSTFQPSTNYFVRRIDFFKSNF